MVRKFNKNLEKKIILDFGLEWKTFDQSTINKKHLQKTFKEYFKIFPSSVFNKKAEGYDMGCGSGRWAKFIAPKVKKMNCIDPSANAIQVAKKNLLRFKNVNFINSNVMNHKLNNNSQDFGYCLGVLHHITDTAKGLKACYKILKKNSPFLLYLYYRFDNKPLWFKGLWLVSDLLRKFICFLPFSIKKIITFMIAIIVYYPLAKIARIFYNLGFNVKNFPLSFYKDKTIYFMMTDSLDRFGTKLEKRFTKKEISEMLIETGFKNIKFSNSPPFWTVVAWKK